MQAISVENLTKRYDLGVIGTGTISRDLNRWWARVRKLPDPYTRIGQKDAFARIGESILALDNVSFTVQQGEALGIIGRNGAGKSTLLKILSRVTAPTSGVVKVKGRIGSLLEVGTGFHPELTGRENVYLNGAILGMKKEEVTRKFDEIVDFSGVEKFIDTPVKRYSSGMYVRLAFAVAAHLDPEILIVDEVLAVGDAEFQKKCLGKMGDVASEGRTVLFVSHNIAAIRKLCQQGLYIKNGKISCHSSVEEVVSRYLGNIEDHSDHEIFTEENRPGLGLVRLKGVKLLNNGKETKIIEIGTPVVFEFLVSELLPQLTCTFSIYNQYGEMIATFSNYDKGIYDSFDNKLKNKIVCEIDQFLLYPGRYRLNVALKVNDDIQDHIEGALIFDVKQGYFDGRMINPTNAKVYLQHRWKMSFK